MNIVLPSTMNRKTGVFIFLKSVFEKLRFLDGFIVWTVVRTGEVNCSPIKALSFQFCSLKIEAAWPSG